MRTNSPHVVIVGGVAAGTAAAAHLKRLEPSYRVTLLEQQEVISYSVCDIPYLMDGRVSSPDDLIVFTPERFSAEKGVTVLCNARVIRIDTKRRNLVWLHTKHLSEATIGWDYLILATGVRPIQHLTAENVFTIRTWKEASGLHKFLKTNSVQHAVVTGGGLAGCEMAETLAGRNCRVVLIEKDQQILSRMLPASHSRFLSAVFQKNGVQVMTGTETWSPARKGNRITGVYTGSGDPIKADLLLLATGVQPPPVITGLESVRTDASGYFLVDGKMKTSADRIYAIGDGARLKPKSGKPPEQSIQIATRAAAMGRQAAESIIGSDSRWLEPVYPVAARFWDTETGSVCYGPGEDEAEYSVETPFYSRTDPRKGQILITLNFKNGSGQVTGGAVTGPVGSMAILNLISMAVNHNLSLTDLVRTGFVYHPMIAPRVNPLVVAASNAQKTIKRNRF